jgi:hypothetical protein
MKRQGETHITYKRLREYWACNQHKVQEVYNYFCRAEIPAPEPKPEITTVSLRKVKACCDRVLGKKISKNTWTHWKQHVGINGFSREPVQDPVACLLVYMAVWRHQNPKVKFPPKERLAFLMEMNWNPMWSIETASSSQKVYQWEVEGCKGKELRSYLVAKGFRVANRTLYSWGRDSNFPFSSNTHYSPSQLRKWSQIAERKLYGT